MKIEGNTIIFKSTPDNYSKELRGVKCNTVRRFVFYSEIKSFELFYEAWLANNDLIDFKICIIDTHTRGQFFRTITDISEYDGMFIFSWRYENV